MFVNLWYLVNIGEIFLTLSLSTPSYPIKTPMTELLFVLSPALLLGLWRRQEWARRLAIGREWTSVAITTALLLYHLSQGTLLTDTINPAGSAAIPAMIAGFLGRPETKALFAPSRRAPEKWVWFVAPVLALLFAPYVIACFPHLMSLLRNVLA